MSNKDFFFFFRFCLCKWRVSYHNFHEKTRRMRHDDVKHIVMRQLNTNEYVAFKPFVPFCRICMYYLLVSILR